jgi:hypothetical protein
MKKILLSLTTIVLLLSSCIPYSSSYYNTKTLTLSGKYVVSKLDVTSVDQNQSKDSLYTIGTTYINKYIMPPFDSIPINRFYIQMDYASIRMNLLGVTPYGRDIWEYGQSPNEIFYNVLGNNSLMNAYLQFTYKTKEGGAQTMTFLIEDDGLESLQLKSSGMWINGKFGEKQVITMSLTRVGP